jgi:prolyl-tRNA editing enzyme YbaK/EbsC (Cys-tRNA(Pro) deacylase)
MAPAGGLSLHRAPGAAPGGRLCTVGAMQSGTVRFGRLDVVAPAADHPDLLAAPVLAALRGWPDGSAVGVATIDGEVADTGAFTETYDVPLDVSANCVVVGGRRAGDDRVAACVVLATTRADVNNVVRRVLDVRKASFLSMDDAVRATGMEYGGITPVGLPAEWPVLVDAAVVTTDLVVIGSGVRHSKLVLPGAALARLPGAQVVEGLARAAQ